jgi:hypothetical protein
VRHKTDLDFVLKDPKDHPKHHPQKLQLACGCVAKSFLDCLTRRSAYRGRRDNANITRKFGKNVAIYSEQKIRGFIT